MLTGMLHTLMNDAVVRALYSCIYYHHNLKMFQILGSLIRPQNYNINKY